MLGHHRAASETPFKWRPDDGPLKVVYGSSLSSSTKKRSHSWTPSEKNVLDPRKLTLKDVTFLSHNPKSIHYITIA